MAGALKTNTAIVFGICFVAAVLFVIYDFGYKAAVSQYSSEVPIHASDTDDYREGNIVTPLNIAVNMNNRIQPISELPNTKAKTEKQVESNNTFDTKADVRVNDQAAAARRRVRTAVVTHLETVPRYKSQFLNLVYPSWTWVNSHRQSALFSSRLNDGDAPAKSMFDFNRKSPEAVQQSIDGDLQRATVLADLIVFIDTPSSELIAMMPPGCHLLLTGDDTMQPLSIDDHFAIGPRCFFVETDPSKPTHQEITKNQANNSGEDKVDDVIGFSQQYRFQHSIEFMLSTEFDKVVLFSGWYDYFLRIDMDSILAPGLLHWAPQAEQAAFGGGYYGDPTLTTHWVREFAKAHHLQSSKTLQGGQSTTYIPTGAPGETWTHAFVHATALVHHEGFLPDECEKKKHDPEWVERQRKYPSNDKPCQWPWWHQGVSSLYGQLLAMEHVFGAQAIRTPRVDFPMGATHSGLADASADMSEVVSIHLLELKHEWASQLNNCDEFRFPEAIAEANAGTKNRLAAKLQALTNVKNAGAHSITSTEPDTSNWKNYCYWFFSRAKARACAGTHSVGH